MTRNAKSLILVPEPGIEPGWTLWVRGILSPLRLPIPPLRQCCYIAGLHSMLSAFFCASVIYVLIWEAAWLREPAVMRSDGRRWAAVQKTQEPHTRRRKAVRESGLALLN